MFARSRPSILIMPGQVQVAGEFQHGYAEAEHVTILGESPLQSLGCKVPDSVIMILSGERKNLSKIIP